MPCRVAPLLLGLGVIWLLAPPGHTLPQATSAEAAPAIGAACSSDTDCSLITNAECRSSTCQCLESHPIANTDECLPVSWLNCTVTAQCQAALTESVCVANKCACRANHNMVKYSDGSRLCIATDEHIKETKKTPVDPVMIAVLVSLVLMFIIICIVLQLFSKARFRQNRTILNSANPRLMNTSFLKGQAAKPGSAGGARGHRGSSGSLDTGVTSQEGDGSGDRPSSSADPTGDKAG